MARHKKKALAGLCSIWFLDESGSSLTPLVASTWAPRGKTPELPHNFGRWDKVSLVSAVGTGGDMYFHVKVKDAFKAKDIAKFLRQLLRQVAGNVVVFLDGANQHKGPYIRKVLKDNPRLSIERLPPYGFDYNADEGIWAQLKRHELANFTPYNTKEQVRGLRKAMRRIQRRPDLVRACFQRTKLPRRDVEMLLNQSIGP